LDNSGLGGGIDSSNFLNTDIGLSHNVFKIKDYYLGVLFHYRSTKIILLSKYMETLATAGTHDSFDEPHYKLKDVNNDGISEFVFYEYDGCNSCATQGIKTLIYGIDTIHHKLNLMLSFSKSVSIYETDMCEKLLREEKSVVHFRNKNEAEIKFFYREKNKKWLFLRTEKYILDTELYVYKKTN
jgi:hypothetical protein